MCVYEQRFPVENNDILLSKESYTLNVFETLFLINLSPHFFNYIQ